MTYATTVPRLTTALLFVQIPYADPQAVQLHTCLLRAELKMHSQGRERGCWQACLKEAVGPPCGYVFILYCPFVCLMQQSGKQPRCAPQSKPLDHLVRPTPSVSFV